MREFFARGQPDEDKARADYSGEEITAEGRFLALELIR